jgi:hypothetical protein
MLNDVLSDAEAGIRLYLDDEHSPIGYGERGTPLRDWIESVAAQIGALRRHLDLADDIPLAEARALIAQERAPRGLASLPAPRPRRL